MSRTPTSEQRLHTVAETPAFRAAAGKFGLSDADRAAIIQAVAEAPQAGDVIPESRGVRKRRFAADGRGKRGGWRVLTLYLGEHAPVLLVTNYPKSKQANIDPSSLQVMKDQKR